MSSRQSLNNSNKRFFYRYASLGTQLLVALSLAVFIGLKADRQFHTLPLFACLLPLLVLGFTFYKLTRETSDHRQRATGSGGGAKPGKGNAGNKQPDEPK